MIRTTIHIHFPLLPGYYTLKTLSSTMENMFKKEFEIQIPTQINQPNGSMIFYNTSGYRIMLHTDLAELFGVDRELRIINYVKRLNSPTAYFIHCDLVDKEQNLLNGKPSTVLARFDVRGKPFEKINYQPSQQHVLRNTSTGDYVNSLTISVSDVNGDLFYFNGLPLEFELEIN